MSTSAGATVTRLPPEPTAAFPYRIVAKVGEGAMGEVFRAEDLDPHRQVAIKVVKLGRVPPEGAQAMVQRFLQEARAAAAISHANVPVIYRVGLEAGWPYIMMEWIDGATLEALLAKGRRFTADQASRLAIEMLSALEAAHAAGIVHRDIKPGNLMLTRDGHIKVTDFGIARMRGESALAHTQAGLILGTPWYAAPEQLAGQAVDRRADLYGVGCVLYEAVTGTPPYRADSIYELLSAIHDADPPAPSAHATGVPPGFDVVVQRALALDPLDRFASARDMAAALAQLVAPAAPTPLPVILRRGSAPTVRRVATTVVDGNSPTALVTNAVQNWPANPLGRRPIRRLLERLVERPIHATPFAGAVELDQGWLLVSDGLSYTAFDPARGLRGDALLETLPEEVDATLHAVPAHLDPEVVPVLASLLGEPRTRLSGLDSSLTDLPGLADKLAAEGFDGALRLTRGAALAFALFRKGRRILDVFGSGWPATPDTRPWEDWIAEAAVLASVEELTVSFPSITFRQQLRGVILDVVRPSASASTSLRSDAVADARALELRPRAESRAVLRRGDTSLQALVDADPACELARWLLTELSLQFAQFGRAARWKALVERIDDVAAIRLHHAIADRPPFEVVTFDDSDRARHLLGRVTLGTEAAVATFIERAIAAKAAEPELGAAILVAPRFEDAGLAAYLQALAAGRSRLGLDGLRHREGFMRVGRGGLHVLLVEDDGGRRRPLVPE